MFRINNRRFDSSDVKLIAIKVIKIVFGLIKLSKKNEVKSLFLENEYFQTN